jgi:CRP/FNR family transcriptional regulator
MTHEQIAEHTNSAREVVARALKKFSNENLVEYKRGCVTLKNLDAMFSLAETR